MICEVKVNNVPKICARKYIVARYCALDDGLWFHSSWDDETKARQVASEVEGVVCLKEIYISIDDVMSVFDDFMCGDVDEDGMNTFLEMLKDRIERSE